MGKALFGGLGMNVFNPALVGRAFVQAAFPVSITTWTPALFDGRCSSFVPSTLTTPFMSPPSIAEWTKTVSVDAFSGATPLGLRKVEGIETSAMDLFTGLTAGSAGETSALLILICGLYLAFRHMLDWKIPVSVMLGTVLTSGFLYLLDPNQYPTPQFMLLSGGLRHRRPLWRPGLRRHDPPAIRLRSRMRMHPRHQGVEARRDSGPG